jgi:hypothetical protein
VVHHQAAILDHLDAGASERLRDLVVTDAELHPDYPRPGGEEVGQVRRDIPRRR